MLESWRASANGPSLTIVGPGEFAPDCDDDAEGKSAARVRKAYSLLRVDDGYLSTAAAEWFATHAKTPPEGFRKVGVRPETRVHTINGQRVAVVFFPLLAKGVDMPTPEQVNDVLREGTKAKANADLVIAVSPWDSGNERSILARCEGVFDLLLGGGGGTPFSASIDGTAPGVIWARPERNGRGLNIIDIIEWPDRATPHVWIEGINTQTRLLTLSDAIPRDPAVEAVIGVVAPLDITKATKSKEN